MPASFNTASHGTNVATSTAPTVTTPSMATGDTAFIFISTPNGAADPTSISGPTGLNSWTKRGITVVNGSGCQISSYTCPVTATQTNAVVTVNFAGSTATCLAIGSVTGGGFDAVSVSGGSAVSTTPSSSVTTVADNSLVIGGATCVGGVTAAGSSYGNFNNSAGISGRTVAYEVRSTLKTPAGATTADFTSASAPWAATSLSFAPNLPSAPAAPTVSSVTTTGAQVNPDALTSLATSCNIQVTTAADTTFASPVVTITGATASANNAVTGLTPGTNYIYRTQMVNAAGTTNGTATATTPTVSSAPTSLAVTNVSQSVNLQLNWTAPTGDSTISSYNVLRSTVNGSGYAQIGTSATNSFTDNTGLAANTNYYYTVQAVNSSGTSVSSSQGTGVSLTPPSAPGSLVCSALNGSGQVALTWGSSAGAASYKVYRATSAGGSYSLLGSPSTTSLTDTTGVAGTDYYYKVTALNSATAEGPLTAASGPYAALLAPTSPAVNASNSQLNVTWTASTGATTYNLYRSTTPGGEVQVQTGISGTSVTDNNGGAGLTNGTQYYYKITPVRNGLEGPLSAEASGIPVALTAPTNLTGTGASNGNVTLSWT